MLAFIKDFISSDNDLLRIKLINSLICRNFKYASKIRGTFDLETKITQGLKNSQV